MNKEEVLAKSQKENQGKDVYELDIINKAQRIGGIVALVVTAALMAVERIVLLEKMNPRYWLIILSFQTSLWIYKAVKMKKLHEILLAILCGVMTVICAVLVVQSYMG